MAQSSSRSGRPKRKKETRDCVVNIRMTNAEVTLLLELVDELGVSGSEILRNGMRQQHEELFGRRRRKTS
jgi:hypothetical protein